MEAPPRPGTNPDRRHRRRRESRARIRAAARALFVERGFEATTVDDIVASADLAQKTFFNHFPTKDALLQELARAVVSRFERMLREECRRSQTLDRRLRGFFAKVAIEAEANRVFSRDLLHRIIRGSSPEGVGNAELQRVREAFRLLLCEGRARGDVGDALAVEDQSDLVTGAFIGVVLQWLNEPGYPLAVRLEATAQFLASALAPDHRAGEVG